MFLQKSKRKDGRVYLSLMQAFRKEGKPAKKTAQSLGYLDELEKEYADPIAHFQAYCDERNAIERASRRAISIEIHPLEKIAKLAQDEACDGYHCQRALEYVWHERRWKLVVLRPSL